MIEISEQFISSIAPNEQAIKNGKDLVLKGKFVKYEKSEDDTLLVGECSGSGKDNYIVSADFIQESKPIFRCSCPSRQLPCKHAIGLLFAFMNGKKFSLCDIPEDIVLKREKIEKREEKKATVKEDVPKKVNIQALIKKMDAQLEGLDLLEKMIHELVVSGLGTMNLKQVRIYEEQAKKLGDYYLTGVQNKFRAFLNHFNNQTNSDYSEAIIDLVELNHLVSKGKDYLKQKKENPLEHIDLKSNIEEQLGNTWQLTQLKELGLVKTDVRFLQLAFDCIDEPSSMQWVDFGIWMDLKDGLIYKTQNFRPYKAAKYIKEDDSCFHPLFIKELYIYPGEINQRVRYEELSIDEVKIDDFELVLNHAESSYSDVVKRVKNIIKNPLSERMIYVLMKFQVLGLVDGYVVIENEKKERMVLTNYGEHLHFLNEDALKNSAVLGYFRQNYQKGLLEFTPLSIITSKQVIRLTY